LKSLRGKTKNKEQRTNYKQLHLMLTAFKSSSISTDKIFGELKAELLVVVDRNEYEAAGDEGSKVENVLKDVIAEGRVGNLQVEPESLVIRSPGKPHVKDNIDRRRK
jgi:hypothetical protein